MKIKFIPYLILCIGIILRCIKFGSVPFGYQIDEAGTIIDAWYILNAGVDRYNISYPVYFINYGGGQSAMYTYLCAISIYLFGFNEVAARLPALVISILFAFFGIKLIGLIWNNKFNTKTVYSQIIFIIIYTISPYCFMSARFGLDCNFMLGMSTIFLYFFVKAIKQRTNINFFIAGLCAGLVLYTYAISYIVLPLFLILSLVYLRRSHKIQIREVIIFSIPMTILAIPLLLVQYVNMFDKEAIHLGLLTITKLGFYRSNELTLSNVPSNLYLTFKSLGAYDWINYNTSKQFWNFYHISAIFLLIGAIISVRQAILDLVNKNTSGVTIIFLWFVAEVILGSMLGRHGDIGANPNANKLNGAFFPVMLFIVCGIGTMYDKIHNIRWRKISIITISIVYLIYYALFLRFYFNDFHPHIIFGMGHEHVKEFVDNNSDMSSRPTKIDRKYIDELMSPIFEEYKALAEQAQ